MNPPPPSAREDIAPPDAIARRRAAWWPGALLLAAAVALTYAGVRHAGFIWDDDQHLTANAAVLRRDGLGEIWTSPAANYFPLTMTTFWALHALCGLAPLPYHVVTVALHAGCAVLLWRVLARLGLRAAWAGAAAWALHPVQAESVAWISELKNTQSAVFFLGSILFYLRWLEGARPRADRFYLGAVVCALGAMLSKSSAVMLPVACLLCAWWRGRPWREQVRWLLPLFLLAGAAAGWTIWEQKFASGASGAAWEQTWTQRLAIAGTAPWFYLGKLLWPQLAFIYPRWEFAPAASALGWLGGLGLLAALATLWRLRDRSRGARATLFAAAFFAAMLFPVLGFFDVFFFRYAYVADHFQYLASMAPLALAVAALEGCVGVAARRIAAGVAVAALAVLAAAETRKYRDERALWEHARAANPAAAIAHNNLGRLALRAGDLPAAARDFATALRLDPRHHEAHNNLGVIRKAQGRAEDARQHFESALAAQPDYADAHYNLANLLVQLGRAPEALPHYATAARLNPRSADVRANFGAALLGLGRVDAALEQFAAEARLGPDSARAHYNLGAALLAAQRREEAAAQFEAALRLAPDLAPARAQLERLRGAR